MKNQHTQTQVALHVSIVSILINIALSLFKLFAGIIGKSNAMISDAVHSASDVFSTLIVMIGVKMADKESDKEHPYGHERMECVSAIILAILLFLTGAGIGLLGFQKILSPSHHLPIPNLFALTAAIISLITKEGMFWYTRNAAKKISSGALMADAWHHRSDALSSIGSFLGIFGARLGFPILDPIASIFICLAILKVCYQIFFDALQKMLDHACDDATLSEIRRITLMQKDVLAIDQLKTRLFGDRIYVDIEIQVDGKKTLECAHEIAEAVHNALETQLPRIKHCMVHVNPASSSESSF